MQPQSDTITSVPSPSWWHRNNRPFDREELLADALVHLIGIGVALALGSALLVYAATQTAPDQVPALATYIGSLICLFCVSMAFNLWPVTPVKQHLARLDQAVIFLFMAGSYTPFLTAIDASPLAGPMTIAIWALSGLGILLKLIAPHRFGRIAILLHLAIGWSGLLILQALSSVLSPTALWLLIGGGIVYSVGIIFHLWEKLRFQNALWHVAVVTGATLHLGAVFECMVLSRL
jgi:hemolysin III